MILLLALSKGRNNFSKRAQTLVNRFKLIKMLSSHVLILLDLLWACKITKIKLASKQHSSGVSSVRLYQNLKDGMRTRWVNIRSRLASDSICLTSFEKDKAILSVGDDVFWLAFNKYACVLVFSNVERLCPLFILKKVKKFLVVNLQKRAINGKTLVAIMAQFRKTQE
jgi:hypothetical protein